MLAVSITDATHFGYLNDNYKLVDMSQTVLVMCSHFLTTLQNTTEMDVTYSLQSDPAVNAT